ncbi:hypothetical protein BH11PSE11_BH11PSE11_32580 [soil metagenome]
MNWISRWLDRRRVEKLKQRIAYMKACAEEVEADLRMPTVETISGRILRERIDVLEKAVEKIENDGRSENK